MNLRFGSFFKLICHHLYELFIILWPGSTLSNRGTLQEEKYLLLPPGYLLMLFGLECLFVFTVRRFLVHLIKLAEVGGGT